jgi:dihydroorotase-like cyclic amidohydrolase
MGQAMPFEGWEVYGKCVKTIVNGITVYNNTNQ